MGTTSINGYSIELISLLKACNNAFNGKYKVTHAIWPYIHNPKTVGMLADVVDQINIMSYGYSFSTLEYLIKQYNDNGFPYEKMMVGIETERGTDTQELIIEKLDLVKKYNLGGIFEWRLDNDGIRIENGTKYGPPTFKTTKILYEALKKF